jgi:hypothetical protein
MQMLHINNTEVLKSIYFAYFHSVMKYGIIFGGNSSYSENIFTLQKKIIRPIPGVKPRNSSRNLFKWLEILTLQCEHIFFLMIFIVKNKEFFPTNSHIMLSTQGIRISFIDQLTTSHVCRRVLCMLALKSSTVYCQISQLLEIIRYNLK